MKIVGAAVGVSWLGCDQDANVAWVVDGHPFPRSAHIVSRLTYSQPFIDVTTVNLSNPALTKITMHVYSL